MSLPATTGSGPSVFAIVRSARPAGASMATVAVAVLSAGRTSTPRLDTVAELTVVPVAEGLTLATTEKTAVVPAAMEARKHDRVPGVPTGGVVHDQPGGTAIDRNVVFAGSGSTRATFRAVPEPAGLEAVI